MKIAFLYKYYPNIGGVERVMTILANQFAKTLHEIVIFSFKSVSPESPYYLNPKVIIKKLPDSEKIDSLDNITYVSKEINDANIDILLNHDSVSDTMNLVKHVKNNITAKVVTLHHGPIFLPYSSVKSISRNFGITNIRRVTPFYFVFDKIKRILHHRKNIEIVDKYVLLCESFKNDILWGDSQKLHNIYNPLTFDSPKFFDIASKENRVVMVGRLSESDKRVSYALKIWSEIERSVDYKDWQLDIVGDGPDKKLYESLIVQLDLKNVNFIGYDDPIDYYRRSKLLFLTSAFEGMPLVLMEASQFGCIPIVMNSFGSLEELISDNVNGIVIPNNNLPKFAKESMSLMGDFERMCRLSSNAIQNSLRFSAEKICTQWIQLFTKLIN